MSFTLSRSSGCCSCFLSVVVLLHMNLLIFWRRWDVLGPNASTCGHWRICNMIIQTWPGIRWASAQLPCGCSWGWASCGRAYLQFGQRCCCGCWSWLGQGIVIILGLGWLLCKSSCSIFVAVGSRTRPLFSLWFGSRTGLRCCWRFDCFLHLRSS